LTSEMVEGIPGPDHLESWSSTRSMSPRSASESRPRRSSFASNEGHDVPPEARELVVKAVMISNPLAFSCAFTASMLFRGAGCRRGRSRAALSAQRPVAIAATQEHGACGRGALPGDRSDQARRQRIVVPLELPAQVGGQQVDLIDADVSRDCGNESRRRSAPGAGA